MYPEEVALAVDKLPYMRLDQARFLCRFIMEYRLQNCLELGFLHGVSSAYIAAALQEVDGFLTTIDLVSARDRDPNIEQILRRLNLSDRVKIYYEEKSYNWRLMRLIEAGESEQFDFCYLDGGHTLYSTGLGFSLVAELLKPGGWVVFDDIQFSFSRSNLARLSWVKRMPMEEQVTPQVDRVFSLMVARHASFGEFRRIGNWGMAKKILPLRTQEQEHRLATDLALSTIIHRAQVDGGFKQLLLTDSVRALSSYLPNTVSHCSNLSFIEAHEPLLPGQEKVGSTIMISPSPLGTRASQ